MKVVTTPLLAAALFACTLLPASSVAAAESDPAVISVGIKLVKEGKYKEGEILLRKALENSPDNPEVNFYLGMALNRTSHGKEAESFLKRALMENPGDAGLNLELGMHYFNKDVPAEAADYFEQVIELAPKSELADRSREFLRKIEESKKERDWSVTVFAGAQYDTNVMLNGRGMPLPEGYSGKSDWSGLVNLRAAYTPFKSGTSEAGIAYSYYQNLHASLKTFDIMQNLAEVSGSHALTDDVRIKGTYSFEYLMLNMDRYDTAHNLAPSLVIRNERIGTTTFDYRFRYTEYSNSAQFADNSDRNGNNYLFGLSHILPLSDTAALWALYNHDTELTRRPEWDYDGERFTLGARYLLPLGLMSDISGDVYRKSYRAQDPQFGNQTRHDNLYTLNLSLTRSFSERFSISLSEALSRNESNIPEFKYDRSITSLLLSAKF